MNLAHIPSDKLLADAKVVRKTEKDSTAVMLRYIMEVARRKLFLERGFNSLYEFVITEFDYTENEALPRIRAMELMRDVPAIEEKIDKGEISLSVAVKAQNYFRRE